MAAPHVTNRCHDEPGDLLCRRRDVPVAEDSAVVEVSISSREKAGRTTVNILETPYFAVSLARDGAPRFKPANDMFHHM